jgi:hypothetical protein
MTAIRFQNKTNMEKKDSLKVLKTANHILKNIAV